MTALVQLMKEDVGKSLTNVSTKIQKTKENMMDTVELTF